MLQPIALTGTKFESHCDFSWCFNMKVCVRFSCHGLVPQHKMVAYNKNKIYIIFESQMPHMLDLQL